MIVAKYIYKFISRAKRQERKELYMEYGILSLAPAFIALVLAFITRDALLSILIGVIVGIIITGQNVVTGFTGLIQEALGNADFMWVLAIEVFIGILVAYFQKSGAIKDEVFADAVVDPLVVAAEDDDVFERREAVGLALVVAYAVGRGVDDLVVGAFGLQFLDQFEDGLGLHHHARLAAEGVVVGGLAAVVGVVVQVVDDDPLEPFGLRALEDRFVEGRCEQLRNGRDDVYALDRDVCRGRNMMSLALSGASGTSRPRSSVKQS